MRPTLSRGRTRRRSASRGSIFLDALLALFIGTAALGAALGGLALAARVAALRWTQTLALIGERNERAADRSVVFVERDGR